jgi:hypothetical protein
MTKFTQFLTILTCTFALSMTLGCGKDASEATVSSVCESIEKAYASMDDKFEMDKCRKHTNLVKGKVGKKGFVTFAECIYAAGTKSEVGACGQKALADAKEAGLGGNASSCDQLAELTCQETGEDSQECKNARTRASEAKASEKEGCDRALELVLCLETKGNWVDGKCVRD